MIAYSNQQRNIKALMVLLYCAVCFCSTAQTVWDKVYTEDRPVMLFSSILTTDNSYIITGGTYGANANVGKGLVGRIDFDGSFINYKVTNDSTADLYGIFGNTLITVGEGKIAFTGLSYSSHAYLLFGIATDILDSVSIFRYYTPNTYAYHGFGLCKKLNDYYIAGVRTDSLENDPNVILVKLDSVGNRQWERSYGTTYSDEAKSITCLSNGNLMLGAYKNDNNQTNEHANTWLIEVDTEGTVIRQWFDPSDSTYAAEGLLQTQDGGFIYGAQKKAKQTINDTYKVGTIIRVDSNFNKQWMFSDGSPSPVTGIFDLEELPDGSLIGCGNKPFYNNDSSMLSGWVVKLSSTGNVIWNRTYAGLATHLSYNYLSDIDILSDGSIIAVGQCQNLNQQPSQVGWFLKLDSNGCEIENCMVGIEEPEPVVVVTGELKFYPNPAQNSVTIEYAGIADGSKLCVVNMIGEIIETRLMNTAGKLELNTTSYQNGVYLARIEAGSAALLKSKFIILK